MNRRGPHAPSGYFYRREFLSALAGASLAIPACAESSAAAATDDYFVTRMEQEHIPGLAVAVLRQGEVVWSNAYGWANLAKRVPMSLDTIQNIGSISKTFAATAAMQLLEAGQFQLDDPVNRYLGFAVTHPVNPDASITVRQLLTHSSGIDDGPAYARAYACGDPALSLEEWLRAYLIPGGAFHDADRNFHGWAPGASFAYCNVGYGLLGHLVERIADMPFADYCRDKVFLPLGMNETSWHLRDIDPARHAVPYSWVSTGEVRGPSWAGLPSAVVGRPAAAAEVDNDFAANCLYNHPNFPDGFLRTSVNQLVRYAQAYLGEGRLGSVQLLQSDTIRRMFQVETGNDHRAMGLCWNAFRHPGRPLLWGHGGGDPGINSNLRLRFEDGVAAIVLMNTNVGRNAQVPVPAPLEFAEYLVDHSHAF
ncbi:serine hydrolase domain-containing protein [Elongatibacter sediminis]|uniref:Serine hydrolase domain-containing protein n=1 Tax=Elongatibacter sediminis TaxID=3119006 RepID=A0AAW9RIK2_9GAMM